MRKHIGMVLSSGPIPWPNRFYKTSPSRAWTCVGVKDKKILDELVETSWNAVFVDQVKDDLHNQPWHFRWPTATTLYRVRSHLCEARYLTYGFQSYSISAWSDHDSAISYRKKSTYAWVEEGLYDCHRVTTACNKQPVLGDYTGFFYLGNLIE